MGQPSQPRKAGVASCGAPRTALCTRCLCPVLRLGHISTKPVRLRKWIPSARAHALQVVWFSCDDAQQRQPTHLHHRDIRGRGLLWAQYAHLHVHAHVHVHVQHNMYMCMCMCMCMYVCMYV